MNRNFDSVLFKIRYIVSTLCNDVILQSKWLSELEWFPNFEDTKHTDYWNLAPEALTQLRWHQLGTVLNTCISSHTYSDWEQRIVDIFSAKDSGDDLPDISDVYPVKVPAHDYQENYYEEMKEERRLGKQEAAASRNDERRGYH